MYSGGSFTLDILPSQGDEEEKTFRVYLLLASNEVQIDPARESVTITVAQRGMPYGTVGFFGDVLEPHKVDEGVGGQTVAFPISRTAPALGDVHLSYTVTGQTHTHTVNSHSHTNYLHTHTYTCTFLSRELDSQSLAVPSKLEQLFLW